MALENLEAATRIEAILNGDDITPATRREYFLKRAVNEVPKPSGVSDAGKVVTVKATGDGYALEEAGGGGGQIVVDNEQKSGVILAGPKTVSVSSGSDAVLCNYSPIDADFFDLSLSINDTAVNLERTAEGWENADWYAYIDTDYEQVPQVKAWFLGKVDGESATITVTDFAYSGYSYSLDPEAAGLPVALFKDESFTALLTQFLGG